MSTKSREVIWGGRIMGAQMRAQDARQRAQDALREADRAEAAGMVGPHGRLRRACPALPDHRSMHQRRTWMAEGGVRSL